MPTMRLGVIGLGGAARQMLPAFGAHPGVRIAAAADPREEARRQFVREFAGEAFDDAERLCASPLVDAVYIASPHHLHAPHCIAAAQHGKHILVEKPMALTLQACDDMIDAARCAGVGLVVGHTHAFDAPVMMMAALIASGEYGPLAMINTWNYNDYLYRPRWPQELRTDLGGGIIFNQVPHQVDVVRLLGGGRVKSVRAMTAMLDESRPTEGSHLTFLQFEDGAAASMVFSGYDYFDSDEFHFWVGELGEEKRGRIHGSTRTALRQMGGPEAELAFKQSALYGASQAGAFVSGRDDGHWHQPHFGVTIASCARGDLRLSADGVLAYSSKGPMGRSEIAVPKGRVFPNKDNVVDALHDSFSAGTPPLLDGRWGKATLEVCLAILTSSRERREVTLSHQVAARAGA
ncbi:MAG: Gfo/Idh/MocA family oxidoreductase [Betaproteobacteria bacterium]|nr:Gfo/Idh/MocA family oxidoreductase [Betaproteobacteria bacterium]